VVVYHGGEVFTQTFTGGLDAKTYGTVQDATLMRAEASGSEILVVVKRGAGVDYAEKEGSPYLPFGDIRKHYPGMTWKDIKGVRRAYYNAASYGPDYESDDDGEAGDENVDECNDVDDYEWPRLQLIDTRDL
jgi:hypothetical protein